MRNKILELLDTKGKKLIISIAVISVFFSLLLGFLLLSQKARTQLEKSEQESWIEIQKGGKLVALCEYSTMSFFKKGNIYLGFEYEILQHIAKELKLKLEVLPFDNRAELNSALLSKNGHLIADFRAISNPNGSRFIFSEPHSLSHLCLVQRTQSQKDSLVDNVYDLQGKTIHVQENSIAHKKLIYFVDEYALNLKIVPIQSSREELLEKVSTEEINFSVVEREIIAANKEFFDNLNFDLQMSFPYRVAFTFPSNSVELRDTVNQILKTFLESEAYNKLVKKYVDSDQKLFHRKVNLLLLNGTQISKIDHILKVESKKIGWDWRLLASLITQESNFNAYAVGVGAFGLMQFIPSTGAKYGIYPNSTPEEQVAGGVQCLKYLDKMFASVPDFRQRIKFVLASYNGGPAHVLDAKRLARHFEEDHTNWDDVVSKYFLKLNDPEYYQLEAVQGGPYRGNFTVNYIKEIMQRFEQYAATYAAE